jgi:D-glutamate cyclase
VLARILYEGLGAVPVFVSATGQHIPIVASSRAAGLNVKDSFEHACDWGLGAALATAPADQSQVADWAAGLFDEMKPKAVFSTECIGPRKDGLLYTATGLPLNGPDTKFWGCIDISPVWTEAEKRGIFRVGVGDWGNELGFGTIWSAMARHVPKGEIMATVTKADVVVPAANSNWGTIGVEACLAFLLKRPELMHTPEEGERILRACLDAGGYESIYCSTGFSVDFLEEEAEMALAQLLGSFLRQKRSSVDMGMTH